MEKFMNGMHLTLSPVPSASTDSRGSTFSPTSVSATPDIVSPLPPKQMNMTGNGHPNSNSNNSGSSSQPMPPQQQQQEQRAQVDEPLSVQMLPYDIAIVTVRALLPCVGAILRAAMFKQNRFVYVSQIERQNTLIVDGQTLSELPRGLVVTLSDKWRGFEIFAGSETLSKPGVVSETTSKLCGGDIPYVYVSVWTSDFVLVPGGHYQEAIRVLRSGIPLRDYGNGEEYDYEAEAVTNRSFSGSSTVVAAQDVVDRDLHIGFLTRREFQGKTYELLDILFSVMDTDRTFAFGSTTHNMENEESSSFSYDCDSTPDIANDDENNSSTSPSPSNGDSDDDDDDDDQGVDLGMLEGNENTGTDDVDERLVGGITLVLDRRANDGLGLTMKETDGWAAIRISNSNPLRPISEPVSGTLAASKIPILFLGTTAYDYVLVPDDKIQRATEMLGKLFESLMK